QGMGERQEVAMRINSARRDLSSISPDPAVRIIASAILRQRERDCFSQTVAHEFIVIRSIHPELKSMPVEVIADGRLPAVSPGLSSYSETFFPMAPWVRKSHGKILLSPPRCLPGDICSWSCYQRRRLRIVARHEFAHLATHRIWGAQRNVPTWIEEGYAELVAADDGREREARRSVALSGALLSLQDMHAINTSPSGEYYDLFYLAFLLLSQRYGRRAVRNFIYFLKNSATWTNAFYRAFHVSLETFHESLVEYLDRIRLEPLEQFIPTPAISGLKFPGGLRKRRAT
ncbi:MAG: hypothetical protein QXH08_05055, partial [Candidatus Hadarchaeales archaeon]